MAYIVANHYTNENIGEFDVVTIFPDVFPTPEEAFEFADSHFKDDVRNGCEHDTVPASAADCPFSSQTDIVSSIGEAEEKNFNSYHNVYAVISVGK